MTPLGKTTLIEIKEVTDPVIAHPKGIIPGRIINEKGTHYPKVLVGYHIPAALVAGPEIAEKKAESI